MNFENVISYLQNKIHPQEPIDEFKKAIEILSQGQGYLTKTEPKRIIFFDDNAE